MVFSEAAYALVGDTTGSMNIVIRSVTVGADIDFRRPKSAIQRLKNFLITSKNRFEDDGMGVRSLRATSQTLEQLIGRKSVSDPILNSVVEFATYLEDYFDEDIWFCLPGPKLDNREPSIGLMDCIPDILRNTNTIFTNTLISSPNGINIQAIKHAGRIIKEVGETSHDGFNNFRFAAMANVPANTPFFPGAYHQGRASFSIALELAGIANKCFSADAPFERKMDSVRSKIDKLLKRVISISQDLEMETGIEFSGVDLSLAPFPGEETSAVHAVERLANSRIGTYEFMFSLYAVNDLLRNGFGDIKYTGFSGTMFSLLEDSWLAKRNNEKAYSIADLILYSSVCGCGIDMLSISGRHTSGEISAVILAICTEAIKWNKPLITRLLPIANESIDKASNSTNFAHDYIVNTRCVEVEPSRFNENDTLPDFYLPQCFGSANKLACHTSREKTIPYRQIRP